MRYRLHRELDGEDSTALNRLAAARRVLAFGVNRCSEELAATIDISGWIEDDAIRGEHLGLPVLPLDAAAGAFVVSCVTTSRPHTALARLRAAGVEFTDVLTLAAASGGVTPLPEFVRASRAAYVRQHHRWDAVVDLLADQESRRTFDAISRYRLEGDLRHTKDFTYRPDDQYFEPFVPLEPGVVFVDGGAYHGETTASLAVRQPDYREVHVFEPGPQAMQHCRDRLRGHERIEYHMAGLHERAGTARFDDAAGPSSAVTTAGGIEIRTFALDDLATPPTFVKLDVEGAELPALRGAERLIKSGSSTLAIAVYHHPSDLWEVPEYVLGLHDGYDVYVRHYTESATETIMYFVPR